MSVRIEVIDDEVRSFEFTSKKTGVVWVKFKQAAALFNGGKYPVPFELSRGMVEKGRGGAPQPLAKGEYELAPEAFKLSKFGEIVIDDRVPLIEAGKASLRAA
jgi:hypothetical protein